MSTSELKVMDSVKEPEVLHRMDGRGVILKVKQKLDIGKMCFSFVQYGSDNKITGNVDCYLSAEEFGLMMENIRSQSLQKQIYREKQRADKAGEKYPNAVYTSPLGGGMHNGKPVSRHFTIGPGSSAEVLFTGTECDAEKSATGAYIPTKGGHYTQIRVSCKYHDLALIAYKWQWLEKDYMEKRYSIANMQSKYKPENKENTPTEEVQETELEGIEFK